MNNPELNIYRAIKAPVQTKLEEILKFLRKDDLLSFAENFSIAGRSKMNFCSLLLSFPTTPSFEPMVVMHPERCLKSTTSQTRALCSRNHL